MKKTLTGKVTNLENHVLLPPKPSTTRICTCGFPGPEQVLLEQARRLAHMHLKYENLQQDQLEILDRAAGILNFRIFDLFQTFILEPICRDDPTVKVHVFERFGWFLSELRKEVVQELEISEIQRNTPDDSEVDAVDEYYRKAPECFTPESYDKYTTDLTLQWLKTPAGKKRMEELLAKGKKKNVQKPGQALTQEIH